MERGYVKLWRKTNESRVFQDPNLLKVWIWCLMRASHAPHWTSIQTGRGEVNVFLTPGQFLFGRHSAAKELRMKMSSVRNRIKKLENMQNLTIEPDNHYSIVTICNWGIYQPLEKERGQQKGQPEDSQRTAKGQPKDTYKNGKKGKKETYTSDFEQFWDVYPKKVSKKKSFEMWQKLNSDRPSLEILLKSVRGWAGSKQWKKDGGQYIPHPTTWLSGRRWEDEIPKPIMDDEPPYWS